MYCKTASFAGVAGSTSGIVATSLTPPSGQPAQLWAAYVIAHLIVATLSLVGLGMAITKLLRLGREREWARSPVANRLNRESDVAAELQSV